MSQEFRKRDGEEGDGTMERRTERRNVGKDGHWKGREERGLWEGRRGEVGTARGRRRDEKDETEKVGLSQDMVRFRQRQRWQFG